MCLILFAYRVHPDYPLVVAANRDEFFDRPSAPVHFWEDAPEVLAGRDLRKKGTWMGITRRGRFAALTNYREPLVETKGMGSRGELVRGFLVGHEDPESYLLLLQSKGNRYPGFNLLVGERDSLWYYSNRQGRVVRLEPGIHGLSNAFLDTPWPKVVKGKQKMRACVENRHPEIDEALFQALADSAPADDGELPDTGVGLEMERRLSPAFIRMPGYGTRSSSVLTVSRHGEVTFVERTFSNGKRKDVRFRMNMDLSIL